MEDVNELYPGLDLTHQVQKTNDIAKSDNIVLDYFENKQSAHNKHYTASRVAMIHSASTIPISSVKLRH